MTELEIAISDIMNLWHNGYLQASCKSGATALVTDAMKRLDDARRVHDWARVREETPQAVGEC
ncbi:MAG TPA: hypothetical protein VD994_19215 [Prosthecobacter sp.]|nr:hypothetical protein [Prosthecobacter sp.]